MDTLTRNNVSAIVEYDYTANEPDELDLIKGAIINNIKIQQGGWWEGTLATNGKTGMFPDNFVRILDSNDDKSPVILRDKSATVNRRCKVVYSYTQHNEDELSLVVGSIIEVLGEVEEGWWRGQVGDKTGVFPSNFVVPIESSPILANKRPNLIKKENRSSLHNSKEDLLSSSPSNLEKDIPLLPPKPIREYCRVEFPYEQQNDDELDLKVGDIITIVSKELPDKGWWKGELRGKVGVFPDNFVTLIRPEAIPSHTMYSAQRQLYVVGDHRMTYFVGNSTFSPSKDSTINATERPPTGTSKVFIKKSGSGSSSQGSNRKDSFGSRDSLNDILSETGIVSGNVAAQRKSLENKKIDLTVNDGRARRSLDTKTSDIRKSLESMEDKKTPPPVLTKKPVVPVKKSTTVTSVAGNLLSGLRQKVKSVEHKLSSHDSMDGIGSSKLYPQIPDMNDKGVVIERMKKDDMDFDNVERGSMLQDMRAGRAKAPRRRPPSAVINAVGESNNNSIYLNGGGSYTDTSGTESRLDSSGGGDTQELAKPKPREWEKRKAPWMEELKASQAKKTSPNVEPRTSERISKTEPETTNARVSLSQDKFHDASAVKTTNLTQQQQSQTAPQQQPQPEQQQSQPQQPSLHHHSQLHYQTSQQRKSMESSISASTITSASVMSSSAVSTTVSSGASVQESKTSNYETNPKKETITNNISNGTSNIITQNSSTITTTNNISDMTKSMSVLTSKVSAVTDLSTTTSCLDDVKMRPTSLSIRNRSVSPIARTNTITTNSTTVETVTASGTGATLTTGTGVASTTGTGVASTTTTTTNNSKLTNCLPTVTTENVCTCVTELQQRVAKLENIVQMQNTIIDDLVRSLKEQTDRVQGLKNELEKYAQCVTQV